MTDPLDSMELVRRAQAGDRGSLNELFERYYPRVREIVRLRLGNRLRERLDSGDIGQQVFEAALSTFGSFEMRSESSLIHWLGTIVQQRIASAAEHEGAEKRSLDREVAIDKLRSAASSGDSAPVFDPKVDSLVPLDKLIRNEKQVVVKECITSLPEKYRELILLRNYEGLSFPEIARVTGRQTEGSARMMHAKAMIELSRLVRARLQEETA